MIKLLKHNFKTRRLILIILSAVAFLITSIYLQQNVYTYTNWIDSELDIQMRFPTNPPITLPIVFACVLATIVPLFEFNFKMRKVNIDQYYSLPIKREKLYLSTFIFGFIEIVIPVTISYIYGVLSVYIKPSMFHNIHFISFYFVLIALTFLLYSIVTFVYTRNNTVVDGLINLLFVCFVGALISGTIRYVIRDNEVFNNFTHLNASYYYLYSPFIQLGNTYELLLCGNYVNSSLSTIIDKSISYSLFAVLGVLCFVLFYLLAKKEKAEDCMQISNSWISYKLMIPLFTVLLIVLGSSEFLLTFVLVCVGAYFAYVIYQRSFKIKKHNLITLISSCALGFILVILLSL